MAQGNLLGLGELFGRDTLLFDLFKREVLGTKRREIMRLVLTEGRRFPKNCRILSP